METVIELALAGRESGDSKVARTLDVAPDRLAALNVSDWAIFRQGFAALLCKDVWQSGDQDDIRSAMTALLCNDNERQDQPAVFQAAKCFSFSLPGFEEDAYFAGFSDQETTPAVIESAIPILQATSEWEWISRFTGALIEIGPPGELHLSYSLLTVPGTIFSQGFETHEIAAETLVHEAAHSTFNLALEGIDQGLEKIHALKDGYYSPWKRTDRPAFGLLHAMFAFGRVEAHKRAAASPIERSSDHDGMEFLLAAKPSVDRILERLEIAQLESVFDELYADLEITGK